MKKAEMQHELQIIKKLSDFLERGPLSPKDRTDIKKMVEKHKKKLKNLQK